MKLKDLMEAPAAPKPFQFKHLPKFLEAAKKLIQEIEQNRSEFDSMTGEYKPNNPQAASLAQEARKKWRDMEDREIWIIALVTQCEVESSNFSQREENLKYSAKRLREVFPNISEKKAKELANDGPEAIAKHIYGNKNGNEGGDDGWLYRGRGWIQLTGKENYANASDRLFGDMTLVEDPDLAADDEYINQIAIDYFENRVIGKADPFDVSAVTSKINTAKEGLGRRKNKFDTAVAQMKKSSTGTAA